MSVTGIIYDRLKASAMALFGVAYPALDYFTTYRCKVVSQSSDGATVDLKPDDPRIPGCSAVKVKWGLAGATCIITPGAYMHMGWENGDPQKRYALLVEATTPTKVIIGGQTVFLGSDQGANFVALANVVDANFTALGTTLGSGTANLGTGAVTFSKPFSPEATGATKVKAV